MTLIPREHLEKKKIQIDLSGPEGNAFAILGLAGKLCKELGLDYQEFHEEATSGDYSKLIGVFEEWFGEFVDIYV